MIHHHSDFSSFFLKVGVLLQCNSCSCPKVSKYYTSNNDCQMNVVIIVAAILLGLTEIKYRARCHGIPL